MFGPVLRKGTIRDQPGFAGGDWQSRGRPGWRASPSRNIRTRWGNGQCRHLRSRSSDGYPLITLPDLCGSGARDPARVVRDMWWSRSFFDRDGGRV